LYRTWKKDLSKAETQGRSQRRSKFGIKNPLRQRVTLNRRLSNRVRRREEQEANSTINEDTIEQLKILLNSYFEKYIVKIMEKTNEKLIL